MEIERTPLQLFVLGKANGFSMNSCQERAAALLENPPPGALDPFSLGLIAGLLQRQRFEANLPESVIRKRFYRELRNNGMEPKHARLVQRGHFGLFSATDVNAGSRA